MLCIIMIKREGEKLIANDLYKIEPVAEGHFNLIKHVFNWSITWVVGRASNDAMSSSINGVDNLRGKVGS